MDMGITKKFFKDRLTAKMTIGDLLNTARWRAEYSLGRLQNAGWGTWEARRIGINLTWKFGNQNVSVKKKSSGAEDESKRATGGKSR